MVQHFQDLIVWQRAMEMVTTIYEVTKVFPNDEKYGLTSQIRRCAVSVPSNIAEGQARNSTGEFKHFLGVARGSLAELTTQILIAQKLEYVQDAKQILDQIDEVGRILNGLLRSLAATDH